MFDLNRTMFYKAEFDVEAPEGKDALWKVVMQMRRWVVDKASRAGYRVPEDAAAWSGFKAGKGIKAQGADVELRSCLHIDDGVYTWAGQLVENVDLGDGTAPRQWVTEVGFRGRSRACGTVSLVLSYGDLPGFIGPLQPAPDASIPRLVQLVLDDGRLRCTVSGIDMKDNPRQVDADSAQAAFGLIACPERAVPIVLVVAGADGYPVDPRELHGALGPNAIVLHAPDAASASALNALLAPYGMDCHAGAVRVYAVRPQLDRPAERLRHRFISAGSIREHGEERVCDLLRRALAQDVHFWQSMLRIDDVKRLNRESTHVKRVAELKERYQDEALEDMLAAEEKANGYERDLEFALEENARLREENYQLESRCQSYEAVFGKRGGAGEGADEVADILRGARQLPPSAKEVARIVVALFPDRLDFTQRGWESLDGCPTEAGTLWAALHDMCTVLHPLYAAGESVDVVRAFESRSRFSLALGEGRMTRKDAKLMASRKDVYQGRDILIEPHVKSSTGDPSDPKFARIYFARDAPSGKLVVGECGGHLDNYSTRGRN